jgi:hypothetical protein
MRANSSVQESAYVREANIRLPVHEELNGLRRGVRADGEVVPVLDDGDVRLPKFQVLERLRPVERICQQIALRVTEADIHDVFRRELLRKQSRVSVRGVGPHGQDIDQRVLDGAARDVKVLKLELARTRFKVAVDNRSIAGCPIEVANQRG